MLHEVFDRIMLDDERRVQYHYVLVDYLCWPLRGVLEAGSDVDKVALAAPDDLERFSLTRKATAVIQRALELAREAPRAVRDQA